jgi:hypothetical protein
MIAVRPALARQDRFRHDVIQPESILNEQEFRAGPTQSNSAAHAYWPTLEFA